MEQALSVSRQAEATVQAMAHGGFASTTGPMQVVDTTQAEDDAWDMLIGAHASPAPPQHSDVVLVQALQAAQTLATNVREAASLLQSIRRLSVHRPGPGSGAAPSMHAQAVGTFPATILPQAHTTQYDAALMDPCMPSPMHTMSPQGVHVTPKPKSPGRPQKRTPVSLRPKLAELHLQSADQARQMQLQAKRDELKAQQARKVSCRLQPLRRAGRRKRHRVS